VTYTFQDMLNTCYYMDGIFDIVGINISNYKENLEPMVIDTVLSGQQAPIILGGEEIGRISKYVIKHHDMYIIMAILKHQKKKFDSWLLSLGQQENINIRLIQ
jgi:hypothetical protein